MASLKYSANSSLQTVTLGSAYTSGSGSMSLTAGHGARLPASGDFWLAYDDGAGTVRLFKVTARSTDTLTVTADATEGSGDGNISSGETLRWALTAAALDQLKSDIVALSGWVLLSSQTASASASLDFGNVVSSTYEEYIFELYDVLPVTNSVTFHARASTDGGSNYLSTSIYSGSHLRNSQAASVAGGTADSSPATALNLTIDNVSNSSDWGGVVGQIRLYSPGSAKYKKLQAHLNFYNSVPDTLNVMYAGVIQTTTALTGLQFYFSSGNISTGTIRCYGVVKA